MKKENLLTALFITLIVIVFGALAFALNLVTGPIIEKNKQQGELSSLKEVMPDAENFELLESLKDVPSTVTAIYKETSGKGYVLRFSTTSMYSESPLVFTLGVTTDGKISGVKVNEYHESLDFKDYPLTFIGKDSALTGVTIHAGVTFSSTAFKNAVEEGLKCLIDNDLIKEGVKTDDQILLELIPTVHGGMISAGNLRAEEIKASGNIVKGYKALSDAGYAFIMKEADKMYLVIFNNLGTHAIYDTEGNDVTADHETLATEASAKVTINNSVDKLIKKVERIEGATDIKKINIEIYNTVVAAVSFNVDGKVHYGFYTRNYGYRNNVMEIFVILDENGAIVSTSATECFFDIEYYNGVDPNFTEKNYYNGLVGLNDSTFDGSQTIIGGATLTSNGFKESLNDAFKAFKTISSNVVEGTENE